jgi:hypothetical protein
MKHNPDTTIGPLFYVNALCSGTRVGPQHALVWIFLARASRERKTRDELFDAQQ